MASASTLWGLFFAGCSDKPKLLKQALDQKAWDLWHQREFHFEYKGESWTIKCVRETGDMAYLNGIHGCSGMLELGGLQAGLGYSLHTTHSQPYYRRLWCSILRPDPSQSQPLTLVAVQRI